MKGGIFLDGQWLAVGTRVEILRDGYVGMCGVFKGKGKGRKLVVNVEGNAIKLHLVPGEIRRVSATQKRAKVEQSASR